MEHAVTDDINGGADTEVEPRAEIQSLKDENQALKDKVQALEAEKATTCPAPLSPGPSATPSPPRGSGARGQGAVAQGGVDAGRLRQAWHFA